MLLSSFNAFFMNNRPFLLVQILYFYYVCRNIQKNITMEKELPKIDLPEDWIAGTDISKELLSLYKNFPVRLKCEIFVLCTDGEVEAMVNLNKITVKANEMVTLMPGSILQINNIEGDLNIYFLGFAADYIDRNNLSTSMLDALYLTLGRPVMHMKPEGANLVEDYFKFVINLYEKTNEKLRAEITANLYADIHKAISIAYKTKTSEKTNISKGEQLSKTFAQLVIQYYKENRNVSWYAEKMGITQAYLCTTVKQVTGRTCIDIISAMVIMDAKSQLKLTKQSIQNISDSLNFANMSFFGKYFKRYVGISPLEYRNNG